MGKYGFPCVQAQSAAEALSSEEGAGRQVAGFEVRGLESGLPRLWLPAAYKYKRQRFQEPFPVSVSICMRPGETCSQTARLQSAFKFFPDLSPRLEAEEADGEKMTGTM